MSVITVQAHTGPCPSLPIELRRDEPLDMLLEELRVQFTMTNPQRLQLAARPGCRPGDAAVLQGRLTFREVIDRFPECFDPSQGHCALFLVGQLELRDRDQLGRKVFELIVEEAVRSPARINSSESKTSSSSNIISVRGGESKAERTRRPTSPPLPPSPRSKPTSSSTASNITTTTTTTTTSPRSSGHATAPVVVAGSVQGPPTSRREASLPAPPRPSASLPNNNTSSNIYDASAYLNREGLMAAGLTADDLEYIEHAIALRLGQRRAEALATQASLMAESLVDRSRGSRPAHQPSSASSSSSSSSISSNSFSNSHISESISPRASTSSSSISAAISGTTTSSSAAAVRAPPAPREEEMLSEELLAELGLSPEEVQGQKRVLEAYKRRAQSASATDRRSHTLPSSSHLSQQSTSPSPSPPPSPAPTSAAALSPPSKEELIRLGVPIEEILLQDLAFRRLNGSARAGGSGDSGLSSSSSNSSSSSRDNLAESLSRMSMGQPSSIHSSAHSSYSQSNLSAASALAMAAAAVPVEGSSSLYGSDLAYRHLNLGSSRASGGSSAAAGLRGGPSLDIYSDSGSGSSSSSSRYGGYTHVDEMLAKSRSRTSTTSSTPAASSANVRAGFSNEPLSVVGTAHISSSNSSRGLSAASSASSSSASASASSSYATSSTAASRARAAQSKPTSSPPSSSTSYSSSRSTSSSSSSRSAYIGK